MKPVYIKGVSAISPQQTFLSTSIPSSIISYEKNLMRCIEPNYIKYLNPVLARRMGRVIKMGIATAIECLYDASVKMPGAIITGTALGCLEDTEKFLSSIIRDQEQFLTPTNFIQSIQNTVSSQIALQLNCTGHNFTFVHKGFSFESALIDAIMLINENEAADILVGGLDEMTEKNFHIYNRLGKYKKENISSLNLFDNPSPGTIGGEGSAFFLIDSKQSSNDYGVIRDIKIIYNPSSHEALENNIHELLKNNNLDLNEISLILMGYNGDPVNDAYYNGLKKEYLQNSLLGYFKHMCGEYQTSGSFALWIASIILKKNTVGQNIKIDKNYTSEPVKNILIINNYENNFSLYLVCKPE